MECVTLLRQELQNILKHQNDFNNHISVVHCFTCGVVPQKLVVSIYNGRCGCPPQHTSRGHIGVRFRVNVLYTFPWHSWLELCDRREKRIRLKQGNAIYWNWGYFKKVNNCLLHCTLFLRKIRLFLIKIYYTFPFMALSLVSEYKSTLQRSGTSAYGIPLTIPVLLYSNVASMFYSSLIHHIFLKIWKIRLHNIIFCTYTFVCAQRPFSRKRNLP